MFGLILGLSIFGFVVYEGSKDNFEEESFSYTIYNRVKEIVGGKF